MSKSDTPRTDSLVEQISEFRISSIIYSLTKFSQKLERELTAVTEQRDTALKKLKNQADRICYLEGATNHATGTPLSKAIEQRDRLAEALKEYREALSDGPENCSYKMYEAVDEFAEKALQSLTTNAPTSEKI